MEFEMDVGEVLANFARAILVENLGCGYWKTYGNSGRDVDPEEAVRGLSVGDVLYRFEAEEMSVTEVTVAHVDSDGVGWRIADEDAESPPEMIPIYQTWHRTKEDAVKEYADSIIGLYEIIKTQHD